MTDNSQCACVQYSQVVTSYREPGRTTFILNNLPSAEVVVGTKVAFCSPVYTCKNFSSFNRA